MSDVFFCFPRRLPVVNPILWWHNVSHNIGQLFASEAEQLKKAEEKTEKLKTAQKADIFLIYLDLYLETTPRPPFGSCAI